MYLSLSLSIYIYIDTHIDIDIDMPRLARRGTCPNAGTMTASLRNSPTDGIGMIVIILINQRNDDNTTTSIENSHDINNDRLFA